MGTLEKEVRIKTRKTKIQRAVLGSIAAVGILSLGALAPNVISLLKLFGGRLRWKKDSRYVINSAAHRLADKGLLIFENTEKGKFLRLTHKGERYVEFIKRAEFKITKPKKWDGKWRIIIFDISERKKTLREKVRNTLAQIGFIRLQDSVWVYPYDCEDLFVLLKADFKIGRDILYIIADKIENDRHLLSHFDIPI